MKSNFIPHTVVTQINIKINLNLIILTQKDQTGITLCQKSCSFSFDITQTMSTVINHIKRPKSIARDSAFEGDEA